MENLGFFQEQIMALKKNIDHYRCNWDRQPFSSNRTPNLKPIPTFVEKQQKKKTLTLCLRTLKVKVQGQNEEMLEAACTQFLGKKTQEILEIARETLEGHQRAIMGNMTVEVM